MIVAFSSLRIANEYERGVVFRLGRLIALRGPGLFFIIPFGVDRLVKIDLRVITLEVPPQEVITNDNVTAKVNAVIYFQVIDARKAVTQVLNYINATSQIAQTAEDHRRADRARGHQGRRRRDQGCRAAEHHAAGDGQAGRGGTREARQDHQRRR